MISLPTMEINQILKRAGDVISSLDGHTLNILRVEKPPDLDYARHLAKIVSKLSPIIANMVEFAVVGFLNDQDWGGKGEWVRQDPDFPDTLFKGDFDPPPGIEIKTWFPLATEMTARFRDSITLLAAGNTHVALIAWLPEYILYGNPRIIDTWIGTARDLAAARDSHYHNPPDYLVIEPQDTTDRTRNLQQTNVAGYKFQGTSEEFSQAKAEVETWGSDGLVYSPSPAYQSRLAELMGVYRYRLDTNFAKIDRIQHVGLEEFKTAVLSRKLFGYSIAEWVDMVKGDSGLRMLLDIKPQISDVKS